jgi:hypothetical protein
MAYSAFGINYDTAAKISAYGGDAETPAQPIWAEDTHQLWIVHGTAGKYRVAMASELASYLTTATASSTYLSKTDAAQTYLTQANASQAYLTQAAAGQTYLSKDDAASTYLGINAKAKTAGTADNAAHANTADSATSATTAQSATNASSVPWTGVSGKPQLIPGTGDAGTIKTYETVVAATTVSDSSARSMSLANSGSLTVSNGSANKAWITVVALAGTATVTLGSSWSWSGSAPTLAKGLVTLAWYGTFGVATFTKFGS